jgi:single-strand DNA-binding protein
MIQASLSGRLGKDPKSIATKTGTAMTAVAVAVDVSSYKGEATVWVNVTAFGHNADLLLKHAKGDTIAACGRLELSHWKGDDGAERERWQMVADQIHSARTVRQATGAGGKGGKGRPKSDPLAAPADPRAAGDPGPGGEGLPFDDDIPF